MSSATGVKIGLALGSGAARGWAHIGVINALEKLGIHPTIVTGTSAGSFVGAAYAAHRLPELQSWACSLTQWEVMKTLAAHYNVLPWNGGLLSGENLFQEVMEGVIGNRQIEKLPLKFGCVATSMSTGEEIWLQSGHLFSAVRASMALPMLISPVQMDPTHKPQPQPQQQHPPPPALFLLDGGIVNPVPVNLCRALGADVVIAVNLNHGIVEHRQTRASSPSTSALATTTASATATAKTTAESIIWPFSVSTDDMNVGALQLLGGLESLIDELNTIVQRSVEKMNLPSPTKTASSSPSPFQYPLSFLPSLPAALDPKVTKRLLEQLKRDLRSQMVISPQKLQQHLEELLPPTVVEQVKTKLRVGGQTLTTALEPHARRLSRAERRLQQAREQLTTTSSDLIKTVTGPLRSPLAEVTAAVTTSQSEKNGGALIPAAVAAAATAVVKTPSLLEVTLASMSIMQDIITKSKLAQHPADVCLNPSLHHLGLLDFHRAKEAMEEGERVVALEAEKIKALCKIK